MSKEIYNLQVPISKDLENKLRQLAEEDERNLRVFCRRILQSYVDKCGFDFTNKIDETVEKILSEQSSVSSEKPNENKKPKVGGLRNPNKK